MANTTITKVALASALLTASSANATSSATYLTSEQRQESVRAVEQLIDMGAIQIDTQSGSLMLNGSILEQLRKAGALNMEQVTSHSTECYGAPKE